jgi:DNA-binding NarL/FixJ family response regulator
VVFFIFSSQETSADIVQEALKLGAWGYVFKTHAASHLLAAIDAALSGKRFVCNPQPRQFGRRCQER